MAPPEGADLREPVVAVAKAGEVPEEALDRPAEIQHAGIGVRDDVRRHRQRQHQGPLKHAAAGEFAHRDQPGDQDPDQQHADTHTHQQCQGIGDVVREDGLAQVLPDLAGGNEDVAKDHQDRQGQDQGGRQRHSRPGADGRAQARRGIAIHAGGDVLGRGDHCVKIVNVLIAKTIIPREFSWQKKPAPVATGAGSKRATESSD